MAAPRRGADAPVTVDAARLPAPAPRTLAEALFEEGYAFQFFQAVRLLEKLQPDRVPVGLDGPPHAETVRFRAHLSLAFPPSQIYEIERPTAELPLPAMTVTFLGLTGPSGVLPAHYTELLLRLRRGEKWPEQNSLRDWLDLFNHRLLSLFHRAWQKYRFLLPYERGEYARTEPDLFTRCLFSLQGLGMPSLRERLRVAIPAPPAPLDEEAPRANVLAQVDDLVLLYYGGLLAHRPRCAVSLEALLQDYFGFGVEVRQFRGQWLLLDAANQSALGNLGPNNTLGHDVVAGERVWDVQGKFRIRLGPLDYARFTEFTPDRTPVPRRKALFLLLHLVRLYGGPEFAFDVQLVLEAAAVPPCQLVAEGGIGPRLGWNTWAFSQPLPADADDACFEGEELFALSAL